MRAVVQRVGRASVSVDGKIVGQIESGLLVFVGVGQGDTQQDADYIATKILGMRIFQDDAGKMNLDVTQIGGSVLIVSQFTLFGDVRKGKRPDFTMAALPEDAKSLIEQIIQRINKADIPVQTGIFGAHMVVDIENNGPVTIMLDSRKVF
ncbi:MAG TPA: D-aminoacyl-tRNA deacylase [Caldisericia bacterium]|nr:D-tyrosyl-tRNA(Tyr) deacylase [Caldisericia bacterium]HOU08464.1 D-aminoacyl-tRNA deacylase [Caldisericia bacterium]HPL89788.1 D-aminoacyl-tRNA deacylase [Caldisericia bacterium]HQG59811.1 D-aminoacyl-tRNA deacylase [Caldisericia bacterium]HQJ44677.1 D-aminoacyl-tRNA deacylase [Caldisericia bacterium]